MSSSNALYRTPSTGLIHEYGPDLTKTWLWRWHNPVNLTCYLELDNKLFALWRNLLTVPRTCWIPETGAGAGAATPSSAWTAKWSSSLFIDKGLRLAKVTSSLNFLISTERSSQWRVYCHFAVFSDSTTCECHHKSFILITYFGSLPAEDGDVSAPVLPFVAAVCWS